MSMRPAETECMCVRSARERREVNSRVKAKFGAIAGWEALIYSDAL